MIKLGDGDYRVWSPGLGWDENHCALTSCHFVGDLFSYRIDSQTSEDGYILRHLEEVTFDRGSGALNAEEENSTTRKVTGFETETATYQLGHCEPAPDPAR
jgi:hypothetical protein